jgi:hypothetical protein
MPPSDDELDRQLAALERVEPAPDFTRRVLVGLDDADHSRQPAETWTGLAPRWSWALGVLLLAVTLGGSSLWEQAEAKRELRGTLRDLETERRALAADFDRLQRDGGEVLYLGSDDRTDYLLDLSSRRTVATSQPANERGAVVAASSIY